jgi:putative spermidine/putrescine transport system ATP-binding protein
VKSYDGRVNAVDGISLDIAKGEFLTLLGPSGSGKTTTLMMIAGFEEPTSGVIELGGEDLTRRKPYERNIGVVFQNYALFPHMTVERNVAFPLRMRAFPRARQAERVREILDLVGLRPFADKHPRELSGGQQQRVALARGLVFNPDVLLLDEPLGALDKNLREQMQIEIRRLHDDLGITTIYVTHDQREALTMSDRVAILKDGRLVQIDRPERLHDYPADSFVASFIGEASLLPVRRVDACSVALGPAVLKSARAIPDGEALMLAVHSEKLLIADGVADAALNRLAGKVTDIVYQGESLRVFLQLADGTCLSLRQPSHYHASRLLPPVGGDITVTLHPEDTIVVPKAQEKANEKARE